ncbi:DegV family protein [Paenibacillus sp. 1P07SE]|uniref:DegV family protein n=1 Tax=Paenibacillus sp. 1P07SE TaxID=3132209 RepID=UPI0039A58E4B
MTIRIVTDSTSDIPQQLREELGIVLVPLKVHFGQEVYLDSQTIQPEEFYTKLESASQLPTTSQPSPNDFMEVYKSILEETPGAQILSFHISSEMSGTYQSAVLAESLIEEETDITVIDSKSASFGFGMRVVEAARMAREGKSKEEILERMEWLRDNMRLYFLVDSLEYLQKGGRIGKASALIGSILNIKPILTVDKDGIVAPVDKVRGQRKAMQRIIDLLKQDFQDEPVGAMMAYSKHQAPATELSELVKANFNVRHVDFTTIGSVIGTHVGPGTAAIFMFRV